MDSFWGFSLPIFRQFQRCQKWLSFAAILLSFYLVVAICLMCNVLNLMTPTFVHPAWSVSFLKIIKTNLWSMDLKKKHPAPVIANSLVLIVYKRKPFNPTSCQHRYITLRQFPIVQHYPCHCTFEQKYNTRVS